MKIKKIFSTMLAAALIFSVLPGRAAADERAGETKTELTNVAKFKPVTTSRTPVSGKPVMLVDDHNNTDLVVSYGNGAQWAMVDLERRYKIERVEVSSRCGSADAIWLSDFEIQASNTEDFSEYTVLDSCIKNEGEALPPKGTESVPFSGSGDAAYRYVRLFAKHMIGFSEFRVFANQTVTEIIPKTAEASSVHLNNHTYVGAAKAIDGDYKTAWVSNYDGKSAYLRADLGEKYHVGYIEIYPHGNEYESRNYFSVCGAEEIDKSDDEVLSDEADLSKYGYTSLAYLNNPAGEKFDFKYDPYPPDGKFSASVDEANAYRYIMYKKTNKAHSQLSEFKMYAVNPVINHIKVKNGRLVFEFSDSMNTDTFNNIKLTDNTNGNEISYDGYMIDDYTYEIDITGLDKNHSYTVSAAEVLNKYGNKTQGGAVLNSLNELSASDISVKNSKGEVVSDLIDADTATAFVNILNLGENEKRATLSCAVFEGDRLIRVNTNDASIGGGSSENISVSVSMPEYLYPGRKLKVLIWESTDGTLRPIVSETVISESRRRDIYVSPSGSDSGLGTRISPYASIERARDEVRTENGSMTEDINVRLMPGIYEAESTLCFTDSDSGKNGFFVNYIGENGAVISGGERVTGFENVSGNLYRAKYSGKSLVHEMYADGAALKRAALGEKVKTSGIYKPDGTNAAGLKVFGDYSNLKNQSDMQAHFTRGWKSGVSRVKSIVKLDSEKSAFVFEDEFQKLLSAGAHSVDENSNFYLENVYEALDDANEFYYDKSEGYIYLMTDGENPENMYISVPVLEQLINIEGADMNNKAENITLSGITFTSCAWNYPMLSGYVGGQAQNFQSTAVESSLDVLGKNIVDSAVSLKRAENIKLINNDFSGIAKVAVGLYYGSSDNLIEGNTFYSIGDSAVTVGLPDDNYMEREYEGYNLAFGKKCTTNAGSGAYLAADGISDNHNEGWGANTSAGGYDKAWWQVDLGEAYEIDRIEIDARKGYNQQTSRRYFEVLASNDPDFSDGGKKIAGATKRAETGDAYDSESTWRADVEDSGKYRYVRVRKTINEYIYLPEIRVINLSMGNVHQKEVCKNNKIYNNVITAIGEFNFGAPGIQTYYTENIDIAHNKIYDVPYTGIAMGWGWTNYPDSVTSKNNKIRSNIIDNFCLRLFDGGGIYTLGQQPGSEISGNYIRNQNNLYGGIYSDNGSSDYTAENNILENVWNSIFISTADKKNLTFRNNYSTTNVYWNSGTNCTVTNTVLFIPGKLPENASGIAAAAGVEDEYKDISERIKLLPREFTDEDINDDSMCERSGSLNDKLLTERTLGWILKGAETMYSLAAADSGYSAEKCEKLRAAIDSGWEKYNGLIADINAQINDGKDKNSKLIDRKEIFAAKKSIENAAKEFLETE